MFLRAPIIGMALLLGSAGAFAQFGRDPPWNPEHIDNLPAEVRRAVLAMCQERPDAGHYFATYSSDRVKLHFEHFHCEKAAKPFCNGSECLHQVYKLTAGHYRLEKSFFGPRND